MLENIIKAISTRHAVATANEWLVSNVGDRFRAGTPELEIRTDVRSVPINYVDPKEGALDSVRGITVSSVTGELTAHSWVEEIKLKAREICRRKRGGEPAIL